MKLTFIALLLLSLPAVAQSLPDSPGASRSFKALAIADWTVTVWDAKVSVSHHVGCVESNPLFGRNPSPARYWTQMAVTTAAVQFAAWKFRQHGHGRIANLLIASDAASHSYGVATNYSACR